MKHLSLIILALFCSLATTVRAQYYSVNYDEKTVEAMAAAYASGAAAEGYYNEQVQKNPQALWCCRGRLCRNFRFQVFGA